MIGLLTHPTQSFAQDYEAFEIQVRPVLIAKCIQCHGEEKQEGGLRLNRREELIKGGEFGQRCLLSRRLVERGVRFIEVSHNLNFLNGIGWDVHNDGILKQYRLI